MADHTAFNPALLKPGLVDAAGNLKPSLTTSTYSGGTPSAATDLKPGIIRPDGTIREGLVDANDNLKPSLLSSGGLLGELSFDGVDDFLAEDTNVIRLILQETNSWSFSGRVKFTGLAETKYIAVARTASADAFYLGVQAGFFVAYVRDGGNRRASIAFTDTTSYHNFCVTWDGTTIKLWVDGVAHTGSSSLTAGATGTAKFQIGRHANGTNHLAGNANNFRLWNSAIGDVEAASVGNGGAPTTARTHQWLCDDGAGAEAADSVGSENLDITGATHV